MSPVSRKGKAGNRNTNMEDDELRRRFTTVDEACKLSSYLDEKNYTSSFELDEQEEHASLYYHGSINNSINQMENLREEDGSNWLFEDITTPPIGLKLTKTPSFLNLIETTLAKNDSYMAEKLKAVSIPVLLLKIGSWQLESRHEGDLVSKCYFAKRKLIWEILEGSLKRKLEMSWSDVIGLHVTMPYGTDNGCDILDVELNQPPSFAQELNPQPRKHTQWQDTNDFTESQALIYRRHHLEFPPGNLAKLYNKLLQNDERISKLSKNPFPSYHSPYFNTRNEFDQSQFLAGHPTSMLPTPQICAPLIPPGFSTPIPGYFHDSTPYQASPFPFTHPNMLTFSDFSEMRGEFAVDQGGVNIVTLQQFDNGNILFPDVPNIVEPNSDLPPLPENTFLEKMEPYSYNSFPGQNFNNMSYLQGSTAVSVENGVNKMNSVQAISYDEATILKSGNSVFGSLDHQGIDADKQIIAMLNREANLQDLFGLLPQFAMPTANTESYYSGFANQ